ncbi:TPA: hypothetical protein SMR42_001572 [Pseudomonas putida]|nr:hypothetical protein [Pseudomonas putida]
MKTLLAIVALVGLAGCSSPEPLKVTEETQECMTYRSMMTAPMAPDAMERLRVDCETSRAL